MTAKKLDLPKSVKLSQVYSFYSEDGEYFRWELGQVVTDPIEIKTLIERGAPLCS